MSSLNDRELLELAAKAAGYADIDFLSFDVDGLANVYDADGRQYNWNPLTDDGDALRLAVTMRLCLFLEIPRIGIGPMLNGPELYVDDGEDEFAAARRSIVRAVAEVGKAMP